MEEEDVTRQQLRRRLLRLHRVLQSTYCQLNLLHEEQQVGYDPLDPPEVQLQQEQQDQQQQEQRDEPRGVQQQQQGGESSSGSLQTVAVMARHTLAVSLHLSRQVAQMRLRLLKKDIELEIFATAQRLADMVQTDSSGGETSSPEQDKNDEGSPTESLNQLAHSSSSSPGLSSRPPTVEISVVNDDHSPEEQRNQKASTSRIRVTRSSPGAACLNMPVTSSGFQVKANSDTIGTLSLGRDKMLISPRQNSGADGDSMDSSRSPTPPYELIFPSTSSVGTIRIQKLIPVYSVHLAGEASEDKVLMAVTQPVIGGDSSAGSSAGPQKIIVSEFVENFTRLSLTKPGESSNCQNETGDSLSVDTQSQVAVQSKKGRKSEADVSSEREVVNQETPSRTLTSHSPEGMEDSPKRRTRAKTYHFSASSSSLTKLYCSRTKSPDFRATRKGSSSAGVHLQILPSSTTSQTRKIPQSTSATALSDTQQEIEDTPRRETRSKTFRFSASPQNVVNQKSPSLKLPSDSQKGEDHTDSKMDSPADHTRFKLLNGSFTQEAEINKPTQLPKNTSTGNVNEADSYPCIVQAGATKTSGELLVKRDFQSKPEETLPGNTYHRDSELNSPADHTRFKFLNVSLLTRKAGRNKTTELPQITSTGNVNQVDSFVSTVQAGASKTTGEGPVKYTSQSKPEETSSGNTCHGVNEMDSPAARTRFKFWNVSFMSKKAERKTALASFEKRERESSSSEDNKSSNPETKSYVSTRGATTSKDKISGDNHKRGLVFSVHSRKKSRRTFGLLFKGNRTNERHVTSAGCSSNICGTRGISLPAGTPSRSRNCSGGLRSKINGPKTCVSCSSLHSRSLSNKDDTASLSTRRNRRCL